MGMDAGTNETTLSAVILRILGKMIMASTIIAIKAIQCLCLYMKLMMVITPEKYA